MAEHNPFETRKAGEVRCEDWEAWLTERLDGTLAPELEAPFVAHAAQCPACGELLARASQGREWLQFLHEDPFVPPGLLGKILDQTKSPAGLGAHPAGAVPVPATGAVAVWHLSMRRGFQETRLLMTLAMAFFSITLTLNLLGVHPGSMRLRDLSFSNMQRTVVSSFYGTKQKVVHTYENLRFIYEMDSQLRDLQRNAARQGGAKKGKGGGAKNDVPAQPNARQWAQEKASTAASSDQTSRVENEKKSGTGLMASQQEAERNWA
ncbi:MULTISPECIES: zf-HC2 domain-containing protein [Acidobacterium]|uniref:Putative zinc-finger domain-containing protein n=1 Tax=Acidobacterium capsulatum (strain ATCC 51196 / DSM 11244 / BCRC 80197 / JCM 7670 / NBRC 15755 / NCIMB 13165 / 161) TaxID=240015 RepID=C1F884_ACIC5|nr:MULTISPECIES: zf-HC2 domain-containing protein [Acidobacterium]ACO34381.1 hypothetical protein ACP_1892 [Acidobacterium capsulatum ATCC 51196]HCT59769.1 zf-HC2 domain-containing protein [Acidobacterium sp.]